MSVEWNDDLDAFFASIDFFNLDFLRVVVYASDSNWFERPVSLELVKVLRLGPEEGVCILRSDINRFLL